MTPEIFEKLLELLNSNSFNSLRSELSEFNEVDIADFIAELNKGNANTPGVGSNAMLYDAGFDATKWFDIRFEFYWQGDKTTAPVAKLFINGTLVAEDNTYRDAAMTTDAGVMSLMIMHQRNSNHTLLIDDVVFYDTDKEYVAATEE